MSTTACQNALKCKTVNVTFRKCYASDVCATTAVLEPAPWNRCLRVWCCRLVMELRARPNWEVVALCFIMRRNATQPIMSVMSGSSRDFCESGDGPVQRSRNLFVCMLERNFKIYTNVQTLFRNCFRFSKPSDQYAYASRACHIYNAFHFCNINLTSWRTLILYFENSIIDVRHRELVGCSVDRLTENRPIGW